MKRKISLAAVALLVAGLASAQNKKEKVPPPPPPPPPVVNAVPPAPPAPPRKVKGPTSDYKAFLKRNPNVKSLGWTDDHTVRIHLKSGKDEVYNLNDKEQAQKLESQYGKLPAAPPPPPTALPPSPPKAPEAPKPIREEI